MIDAAVKSLMQMFSPPFRGVLFKSAGLALALIVLFDIVLHRLLVWLTTAGAHWAENMFGVSAPAPVSVLLWIISIAAGIGIIVGSVFLMPAVTALVGSFFVDDIALEVERTHYPEESVGTPLPLPRALIEGIKTALLAILVYLIAVPFLLFAGAGAVIFSSPPPTCSAANISSWPPCAITRSNRPNNCVEPITTKSFSPAH